MQQPGNQGVDQRRETADRQGVFAAGQFFKGILFTADRQLIDHGLLLKQLLFQQGLLIMILFSLMKGEIKNLAAHHYLFK